jgi:hypothetical protein
MICYQCGHKIKVDFARFCDHCGSSLEIKPKKISTQKEVAVKIEEEIDQATNLFLLWNLSITGSFVFYIIHIVTDGFIYLFLLTLFMLVVSWILLLTKLHDLALINHQSTKKLILTNFGAPIIGTFYSFIKLTQK